MRLLVIISVFTFLLVGNGNSLCQIPNTGTVLFRNIDMHRKYCWSHEELALVYSRRTMMELVPTQIPHNIPLILEYIHICLAVLQEHTSSKPVYDYMLAALADTFGGYLQTYGFPLLHESYYEGYVSYDNAAEVHNLQDSFKELLMTNGEGWTKSMEVKKHINGILPLKLSASPNGKPCSMLFTDAIRNSNVDEISDKDKKTAPAIPLPVFDDYKQPNSIAVPFKNRALFNLKTRSSYDVLIKYYVETSRCIALLEKFESQQDEFDQVFLNWIRTKVVPHLKDDVWYVGFSNVLRIEETIHQKVGIVAASQDEDETKDMEGETSILSELESEAQLSKPAYIAIFLILLFSLLFICFLYWSLIKRCFLCCARVDVESSKSGSSDISDQTSLLSRDSDDYSAGSGKGKKKGCPHKPNRYDPNEQSPQTAQSNDSRLNISCGLGKSFGSKFHKHRH